MTMHQEQKLLSRMLRKKTYGKNLSNKEKDLAHAFLYRQIKGMEWTNNSEIYGVGFRIVEDKRKACSNHKAI